MKKRGCWFAMLAALVATFGLVHWLCPCPCCWFGTPDAPPPKTDVP